MVLLGSRHSGSTQEIREFLSRNGQPFTYQDVETDPSVQALLDRFHIGVDEVPVIVCHGGHVLRNPSIETLSSALGLSAELDATEVRDVVIVGAGPAGLAAAVYGASEGLDVLVLESKAPGGQAGTSSRIENYLGFPTGISGQALAGRALSQAEKIRRRGGHRPHGRPYRLRQSAVSPLSVRRSGPANANHHHRQWGPVQEAQSPVAGTLRGGRCLLLRHLPRESALPGRGGRRRGRGQLGRAGGGLPRRRGRRACTCWCVGRVWPTACRAI